MKEDSNMTKKEKFLTFVYLASIARDLARQTGETAQIASVAQRIPEKQIPTNTVNAARVFVTYVDRGTRPFKWMRPHGEPVGI
jgi:hypothetical protein